MGHPAGLPGGLVGPTEDVPAIRKCRRRPGAPTCNAMPLFSVAAACPLRGCKGFSKRLADESLFPGETLLRLLLPLNDQVWITFRLWVVVADLLEPVRKPHLAIQSVVATGGVYKGQGRNQRMLMTCAY